MTTPVVRPTIPFKRAFYEDLAARHDSFRVVSRTVVPMNTGHGARVTAGQTFRLEMIQGAQIIDLDMFAVEAAEEHYSAPTQVWAEGGRVSLFTRIWGNPPRSRPLATVIADRITFRDEGEGMRDHKAYGAHCNPHDWMLFAGFLPNTCYDNLRSACESVGLPQRSIHDNLNLYMKSALDPTTGRHLNVTSDAAKGDYIQFYAETDLLIAFSLCPYGDGSVVPQDWATTPVPRHPVALEIADSDMKPLRWPYP
jgi:uncharacterized protein YcgI (DUF1989 family)